MPKKKKTITEDHWWGSLTRVDKQKHIPNDPMSKASRVLSGGIKKAGDFVKSSVTKGFKSYVGTKGIHLTNTNVNGIQSGQIKGRTAPMPGLAGKAKADSTYNANYKKWVGKADPMVATKSDYNYMLKQKKNK